MSSVCEYRAGNTCKVILSPFWPLSKFCNPPPAPPDLYCLRCDGEFSGYSKVRGSFSVGNIIPNKPLKSVFGGKIGNTLNLGFHNWVCTHCWAVHTKKTYLSLSLATLYLWCSSWWNFVWPVAFNGKDFMWSLVMEQHCSAWMWHIVVKSNSSTSNSLIVLLFASCFSQMFAESLTVI